MPPPPPPSADASMRHKVQRLQQQQREEQEERLKAQQVQRFQRFAMEYEINVQFPAAVESAIADSKPRTDPDLIQHRLLEAGFLYDVPVAAGETLALATAFCADLERTGCFNSVQAELGKAPPAEEQGDGAQPAQAAQVLRVKLDEKQWYRLHAGGGVKTDGLLSPEAAQSTGFLPVAEFDASVGLRNLTGHLDQTNLQYTLDTQSTASWTLSHERPLYTALPASLKDLVLEQSTGSQYSMTTRAVLDTVDYEWTRSYKEFQRLFSVTVSNHHSVRAAEQAPGLYYGLEWSTVFRDLVPRRHPTTPFAFAASPEIVSQAGPDVKHSLAVEFRTNDTFLDHASNPTAGVELHGKAELATPPGDVGFLKCHGGLSMHLPVLDAHDISLHGSLTGGLLQSLSFGGLCRPAGISDRFFMGGPVNLRGFMPAGIGPRATAPKGSCSPGGDALGGDFFYSATAMASAVPSPIASLLDPLGIRLLAFCNVGTCVGAIAETPLQAVLQSTRASVGVGIASSVMGPRVEATYAWPLRYGPRDARRHFQLGMGFSFG
jgi:outer membrane protein assembly factor BamA